MWTPSFPSTIGWRFCLFPSCHLCWIIDDCGSVYSCLGLQFCFCAGPFLLLLLLRSGMVILPASLFFAVILGFFFFKCEFSGSNSGPYACKASTLVTELSPYPLSLSVFLSSSFFPTSVSHFDFLGWPRACPPPAWRPEFWEHRRSVSQKGPSSFPCSAWHCTERCWW